MRTGYCGMTANEAWLIPESIPDNELDEWAYYKAVDHAGYYGIYPPSEEDEDEDEKESGYSGENIEGNWRLFEDKDLGKVTYGSKDTPKWNTW